MTPPLLGDGVELLGIELAVGDGQRGHVGQRRATVAESLARAVMQDMRRSVEEHHGVLSWELRVRSNPSACVDDYALGST